MDIDFEENITDYIRKIIKENYRIDKRGLLEYRDIKIIKNYVKNAEGSCYLELGKTKVLAGVKLEIAEPFQDNEDSGILVTTVNLSPVSDIKDVLPSDERVRCEHVANYAAQLRQENQEKFKRVFSQLSSRIDPAELPKHFEEVLERIKAAYKAVIEASTRQQVTEVTGSE